MHNITQAQKKILEAVQKSTSDHGLPPTLRELCDKTGLKSTWTVRYHLKKLENAGYLSLKESLSRGITLLKQRAGIPLVGKISAGKPIDAIENIEGGIDMTYLFSNVDNIFALKVKGDSMTGAGIFDGDIVFIKKQSEAANGDIVAAIINDEATVKRFSKSAAGVKLTAENPKYEPIVSKNIKIAGKVVGIIRKYK